jgi:integrase/recombinase XerD
MADLGRAAHRGDMAALDASSPQSRELGLTAGAHLSRYRGTSREHTESDLRVFFGYAQRNDLELYLRWM